MERPTDENGGGPGVVEFLPRIAAKKAIKGTEEAVRNLMEETLSPRQIEGQAIDRFQRASLTSPEPSESKHGFTSHMGRNGYMDYIHAQDARRFGLEDARQSVWDNLEKIRKQNLWNYLDPETHWDLYLNGFQAPGDPEPPAI